MHNSIEDFFKQKQTVYGVEYLSPSLYVGTRVALNIWLLFVKQHNFGSANYLDIWPMNNEIQNLIFNVI